ncbi:hypothetical protein CCP4SC76_6720010 [Gammaproteobacteria bacterium]
MVGVLFILRLVLGVIFAWGVLCQPVYADSQSSPTDRPIFLSEVANLGGNSVDTSEGVPAWMVSQGKTVTYRLFASLDALVVGYLYTGTMIGGGGIALINVVIGSVLYDMHEILWNDFGPDPQSDPTRIALLKTISFRMVSIANILATGLYFTGDIRLSSALALGNAVIDSTIYFFHELAWSHWGPKIRKDVTKNQL